MCLVAPSVESIQTSISLEAHPCKCSGLTCADSTVRNENFTFNYYMVLGSVAYSAKHPAQNQRQRSCML